MRPMFVAAAAMFAGLAISPASADSISANRTVAAGTKLLINNYSSLNEDCSSTGDITVRVVTQPKNGVVTIHKGQGYSNFPANNPRHVCNARKTPTVIVEYKPVNGYVGPDYIEILAIDHSGFEHDGKFTLTVK